jgi:NADH-quinone oxidoreductase subunit M
MISLLLVLIPLFFGISSFFVKEQWSKTISIVSSLISLGLVAFGEYQHVHHLQTLLDFSWVKEKNNGYFTLLSLGDLGLALVLLTNLLFPLIVIFQKCNTIRNVHFFFGLMLLMQAGLNGVFMAQDVILFYIFFELGLVPAYLLVGIWGNGDEKAEVSFKFFAYTMFGSLLMLVGIIYLIVNAGGSHQTDFNNIYRAAHMLTSAQQIWVSVLFLVAFFIKMPVFPFHTWQAKTYATAPTSITIIMSAIMAKMGAYGILRFNVQFLTLGWNMLEPYIIVLAVVSVLYTAIIAIKQDNFKYVLAFSSVSHLSLILAAIATLDLNAGIQAAPLFKDAFGVQTLKGIVFQLFSHGIIVAGLLMLAEWIEKGSGTLDLNKMGGFAEGKRFLPIAFMVMLLGSIALPLTSGFIGEFLLLNAVFHYNYWLGGIVAISIILGAVYMLRLFQKSMLGTNNGNLFNGDLSIKEHWIIIPLMIFVVVGGIFPNWVNQFLF